MRTALLPLLLAALLLLHAEAFHDRHPSIVRRAVGVAQGARRRTTQVNSAAVHDPASTSPMTASHAAPAPVAFDPEAWMDLESPTEFTRERVARRGTRMATLAAAGSVVLMHTAAVAVTSAHPL